MQLVALHPRLPFSMPSSLLSFLDRFWRLLCRIARALWEVVCWLIVPVVFGYLCYASITKKFEITVFQSVLAGIALTPWLLRLFAQYLSEFDISIKGVSAKTRETVRNRDEIDDSKIECLANEKLPEVPKSPLDEYMPEAKKVLRTLWKYQVEHFGPDDIRRWGFSVGEGAQDYSEFLLGITQPLMEKLISVDSRGFVFLTNHGVAFCKEHNREIVAYPFYYSRFSN